MLTILNRTQAFTSPHIILGPQSIYQIIFDPLPLVIKLHCFLQIKVDPDAETRTLARAIGAGAGPEPPTLHRSRSRRAAPVWMNRKWEWSAGLRARADCCNYGE